MTETKENPWFEEIEPDKNPFIRSDRYGELGMAPQPLQHRIFLLLMSVTLLPLKVVGALACLLSYWVVIKLSFLLPALHRSDWVAALGKIHCRACLFCLGFVRITWIKVAPTKGDVRTAQCHHEKVSGIVSNHTSWLDILVHMSRSFPSFVARDKTPKTPIIGTISQAMGCIYVDRSKGIRPNDTAQPGVAALVKQRMLDIDTGRLPDARPMLLFPEGTTSNGKYMLPFKTGAFLAGTALQPVLPFHTVTCYELPVYVPNEEEKKNPKLFANNVRKVMMDFSGLPSTDLTYDDKILYLQHLRRKYGLPVTVVTGPAAENGGVKKQE